MKFLAHLPLILLIALSAALAGCGSPSELERIQKRETLHVISRNAPGIYYEGRENREGLEYELISMFAGHLGVELDLKIAGTRSQVRSALDNRYTNMAAAMIVTNEVNTEKYLHTESFLETTPLIVYRYGSTRPRDVKDLVGKRIAVAVDSHLLLELQKHKEQLPSLEWEPMNEDTEDLIRMVQEQIVDYALVYSLELQLHRPYYPRVRKAFELAEPSGVSWFFPKSADHSLLNAANEFIREIKQDGTLMYLKERYYGHLAQFNYVGARTFIRHSRQRLPKYEEAYKEYSEKYDTDWRLMAAIGYQESHWRANAISPTGVRGLMMLTQPTAKDMGVENRLDPIESIRGGIKYFSRIHKRIPERIPEPDRTWFALASYNVGYGHLEDARILTEKGGKDPDKWADVKEFLPLLQQKKYYSKTRYGYARGTEPVIYVQNIRRYYDVLRWIDEGKQKERPETKTKFEEQLIRYRQN